MRPAVLVPVLALLVAPTHVPARVRIAAPAEGARVSGATARVVLVGEGGRAAATFRLDLDGQSVDATGRLGGLFSTLTVRPGEQLALAVPVAPGAHTLTVTPDRDTDSASPVVVRRFRVASGGGTSLAPYLAGLTLLAAVVAAVVLRRRTR